MLLLYRAEQVRKVPLLWTQSWSYLGLSASGSKASQGAVLLLSGFGKGIGTDFPREIACIFVALRSSLGCRVTASAGQKSDIWSD